MTGAGQFLLYLTAFLLPWWVYAQMPQYVLFPLTFVTLALVVLFAADSIRHGWQIPFELTLPLGILAVLSAGAYVYSFLQVPVELREPLDPIYRLPLYLYPFVALATLHFARPRRVALTTLNVLALSAAAAAAIWLLAWFFELFPTASRMGIASWRPPDTVVYGLIAALFGAARYGRGAPGRLMFGAAVAVLAAKLVLLALPAICLPSLGFYPLPWKFQLWILVTSLLVFWPLARVAAKLEVVRRESEDRRQPWFMLALLGVAALAIITFNSAGNLEFLILGLAGAWALPEREQAAYHPDWKFAAVLAPLCALIGFNLVRVNPENHLDPRNYAPSFPGAMFEAVDNIDYWVPTLQAVEKNYPGETQTDFWLAYAKMFHGDLYGAARKYRNSLMKPHKQILPPPTAEQRRVFMDKLRDRASATPPAEHRGAYVLALISEGRYEEALSLMQRDAQSVAETPRVDDAAHTVFSQALQAYLHDPRIAESLTDWPARNLLALLMAWGAKTDPVPNNLPLECLPAVLLRMTEVCDGSRLELLSQQGAHVNCLGVDEGLFITPCEGADPSFAAQTAHPENAPVIAIWLPHAPG